MGFEKSYSVDKTNDPNKSQIGILKTTELGKSLYIEDEPEETTKMRKSRRVSFSAQLQIKEIENNHDLKENDLITIANTNANANTNAYKVLATVTNNRKVLTNSNSNESSNSSTVIKKQTITSTFQYIENEIRSASTSTNLDSSDMEITDASSFIRADSLNVSILDSTSSMNDDESLVTIGNKIGHETVLCFESNQTVMQKSRLDNTCNNSMLGNETVCAFSSNQTMINQTKNFDHTMDIDTSETTNETVCAFNSNQTIASKSVMQETMCTDSMISFDSHTLIDKTKQNETAFAFSYNQTKHFETNKSINDLAKANETAFGFSCNQTKHFETNKSIDDLTKANETACGFSCNQTKYHDTSNKSINEHTKVNETSIFHNSNHSKFDNTNQSFSASLHVSKADLVILEAPKFMSTDDLATNLLNEMLPNKENLLEQLNRMKTRLSYCKEKKASQIVNIKNNNEQKKCLNELNKELKSKLDELRNEKLRLKQTAGITLLSLNQNRFDKIQKEVNNLVEEMKSLKKEHDVSIDNLNEMNDKVKTNFNNLITLKANLSTKQKLIDLGQDIFSDQYIDYKLIHMEKDTIILAFFFDFIQLEIQATNIVNDINCDPIDQLSLKDQKCLNYPIQKLFTRSTIDSLGSIDTPFYANDREKKFLKKKSTKNVPVFVRYCVDLILQEIGEGDLLEKNKKYKYIRDIPMLISHLRLSCKCAANLARDFEHFASVSYDTKVKCDFDFKNHVLSIILPSLEDACYYKLKLSILPGRYYQEEIPFEIELLDPNDPFQPNVKRISQVVQGQYFEDGSLRNYLKKLKLV